MIGSKIIELPRVDSTNDYAATLISKGKPAEGTVIWALEQFQGRGQNGNHWYSESGRNLTFTVILTPRFLPPDRQFLLNKAISLGVLDFAGLSGLCHPVSSIKWPNDIYIGIRKLGGILINHRIMGESLDSSIIGIGININQEIFHDDLPNPVSMKQITGKETDLGAALDQLCSQLDKRYTSLRTGDIAAIERDYTHSLLGFGEWREFVAGDTCFEGRIEGVDDLGCLLVEKKNHGLQSYNHKEIEIIL